MSDDKMAPTATTRSLRFTANLVLILSEPVPTEIVHMSLTEALEHLDPYIIDCEISNLSPAPDG